MPLPGSTRRSAPGQLLPPFQPRRLSKSTPRPIRCRAIMGKRGRRCCRVHRISTRRRPPARFPRPTTAQLFRTRSVENRTAASPTRFFTPNGRPAPMRTLTLPSWRKPPSIGSDWESAKSRTSSVSFSSVDYVGHAFGPRSWEIQDILLRLDRDLGALFSHLDATVGKGNYVVAFSADHGVVPIPDDLLKSAREAGWLNLAEVQAHIEMALEPFHFPKPIISGIAATDIYFAPGVYDKLKSDAAGLDAVRKAIEAVPGVFAVYRAEELEDSPATRSPLRTAQANSFFPARSGDLLLVPKPYWPWDSSAPGKSRTYATTHGTPYAYDQRVPVLFMGYGIQPGEYFQSATPADIAPTLAALCGVTLAGRDGHILFDALKKSEPAQAKRAPASFTPHSSRPRVR